MQKDNPYEQEKGMLAKLSSFKNATLYSVLCRQKCSKPLHYLLHPAI